jgi:hypothetical protein
LRALGALAVDNRRGRGLPPVPPARGPPHRARDGCAPACHPRSTDRNRPIPYSSAASPWAAPAIAARRQHKEDAVQNLAHINRALAAAVFSGVGSWAQRSPIRPKSNHSDNEDRCSKAVFRLPHRGPLANLRIKRPTESQLIHQTQQLPGSALSKER